jgi:methionyl-tRNA formyltransferase
MTLRIVFAGTPAFAVPALVALAAKHHIVGVLTQPDRPAGRGLTLAASAVKQHALQLGVPVAQPASLALATDAGREARAQLAAWAPDVMVVVAYGLILPRDVLDLPRYGCLNIHASLLPRWRGAAPIQRALLAGDADTGITIMQMAAGLDTGDMLRTATLPIGPTATTAELHDQLAVLGASLIVATLDDVVAGRLQPRAQEAAAATYAAKLDKEEGRVDWRSPAPLVDRRIRAYAPWPAATTSYSGDGVKLLRSCVLEEAGTRAAPGTLLGLEGEWLRVACGAGVVGVAELQRAGKRRVSARDFANAELRGSDADGARRFE